MSTEETRNECVALLLLCKVQWRTGAKPDGRPKCKDGKNGQRGQCGGSKHPNGTDCPTGAKCPVAWQNAVEGQSTQMEKMPTGAIGSVKASK